MNTKQYKSQAAKDAQKMNYGDEYYWQYLDDCAEKYAKQYADCGNKEAADKQFTRTLSEALQGNDGE